VIRTRYGARPPAANPSKGGHRRIRSASGSGTYRTWSAAIPAGRVDRPRRGRANSPGWPDTGSDHESTARRARRSPRPPTVRMRRRHPRHGADVPPPVVPRTRGRIRHRLDDSHGGRAVRHETSDGMPTPAPGSGLRLISRIQPRRRASRTDYIHCDPRIPAEPTNGSDLPGVVRPIVRQPSTHPVRRAPTVPRTPN